LRRLGIRPSRKLGQNFLTDPKFLQWLAQLINPQPAELLVEIGAGTGNLTDLLVSSAPQIIAIEYDARLASFLRTKYKNIPTITLLQADAARIDYDELTKGVPYRCVGNLPYSSSSVMIATILESANKPRSMYLMLQKEMAERLNARPACKSYGSLSVRIQSLYDIKLLRHIPPVLFWPVPKVESILVSLKLKATRPDTELYKDLSRFVRVSFSHRRKKVISNLRTVFDKPILTPIFQKLNICELARPEELTPEQYVAITRWYQQVNHEIHEVD